MNRSLRSIAAATLAGLMLAGCSSGGGDVASSPNGGTDFDPSDNCTHLVAAVSSEKMALFQELSTQFQSSPEAQALAKCAKIVANTSVGSGESTELLKSGWNTSQTDKQQPVLWAPASSTWVQQVINSKNTDSIGPSQSIARSPVVMAMPEQMAQKLGWPTKQISMRDLHDLCLDPAGWGKFGPGAATWGGFKLGKTNPFTSATGSNVLLMQAYAATGKQAGLTPEDINASFNFSKELESCVIHYGDTTGNVLKRGFELASQGKPLGYVSAVAVEETSVINYNLGNPDSHAPKPGEVFNRPASRMVAVYPSEGSLESDNPLVVLDASIAPWVTPEERTAAEAFQKFATSLPAQKLMGDFGFRPADPTVLVGGQVNTDNGVDPSKPVVKLEQPSVPVTNVAKERWNDLRKPSNVLFAIDVSGSMVQQRVGNDTFLTAAIRGAQQTLGHFRPSDNIGVITFTTDQYGTANIVSNLRGNGPIVSPLGGSLESLKIAIGDLQGGAGTPLYDTLSDAYRQMNDLAEPGRINAIVLLSDGKDENSTRVSRDQLMQQLDRTAGGETISDRQVRVFPIIYGESAPSDDLNQIARLTGGQVFDSSDPRRINLVFSQVINNF